MKVDDLKDLDFAHWKHHPVTEVVMKFLADYRKSLIDELLGSWEGGSLDLVTEKEIRGRTAMISEVTELELNQMKAFYGVEDAAKTNPDGTSQVHPGQMDG